MTFGCHIIAIEILVLWKISMGGAQRNIKLSKRMYCVIRVKLKINVFYVKKIVLIQIEKIKWPRASDYKTLSVCYP